jgi:hypothetical protein
MQPNVDLREDGRQGPALAFEGGGPREDAIYGELMFDKEDGDDE